MSNLIPTSIELHISTATLKPAHSKRLRALGCRILRVTPSDSCRIVNIPTAENSCEAWALAATIAESYPLYRETVVIFRGCEDAGTAATVVQRLKRGEPLALAYGRYCAQTTRRLQERGEAR